MLKECIRNPEIISVFDERIEFAAFIDQRKSSELEAQLGLYRTIVICFLLSGACLSFSQDAQNLVLDPVERMIVYVKKIATNPLSIKDEGGDADTAMDMEKASKKERKKMVKAEKFRNQMETKILEDTINKISKLLAIGFGDAGSEIIASNISKGGDLNPMIEGKKMMGI